MKYFVYIDESGQFDEGLPGLHQEKRLNQPVVGGVCSTYSEEGWTRNHRNLLKDFNEMSPFSFEFPGHFHCAELFGDKMYFPLEAPTSLRRRFSDAVLQNVLERTELVFASRNPKGRFEYSPQATYVLNLVTALRGALHWLASTDKEVSCLGITVAQRTIAETVGADTVEKYTSSLLRFVGMQLEAGGAVGAELARDLAQKKKLEIRSDIATRNAGLMAADFVCNNIRRKALPDNEYAAFEPDNVLFGDYERYYDREVLRLLDMGQYATAAEFLRKYLPTRKGTPDLAPMLHKLRLEQNVHVLGREFPGLLAEAHYLIERRTEEIQAMDSAQSILEALTTLAEDVIEKTGDSRLKRQWADLFVNALVELGACYNHKGAVGPQNGIEEKLEDALARYGSLLSRSYTERTDLLLEARTRNLNLLFNDYRFADVLDVIDSATKERERQIPIGETDELLGKMLGSLGQACAFLARTDPSWTGMARGYFHDSIKHFEPGTLFHSMSANYLSTLAWQERDLELACREMNRHPELKEIEGPSELTANILVYGMQDKANAFDVVNYLRIAAAVSDEENVIPAEQVKELNRHWRSQAVDEHPHEQVMKWLGYLAYKTRQYYLAEKLCEEGLRISRSLGFTVQTIGLSILGLMMIVQNAAGQPKGRDATIVPFRNWASELAAQSEAFADYLAEFGGPEGLVQMIAEGNGEGAKEITCLLPFNYS
jgi:hypothetical protein